ncbi:MAG: hypothetical protein WAL71_04820 [Terriglobales bacterium]
MSDPEEEQIREVYVWFGLASYNAQCLERALAMFLAGLGTSDRFTAWDYDDRLAGNFESTFGALVTTFSKLAGPAEVQLLGELEKAVEERNELIHRYFWNRAVQLVSTEGRSRMIGELQALAKRFDGLDSEISGLTHNLMERKGVSKEVVEAYLVSLLDGTATPHDSMRLRSPVVITAACRWKVGDDIKSEIIFTSNAGNLVPGEKGLCWGPQGIPNEHLQVRAEFAKAFPANVNPKPKNVGSWNYVIQLANNYELRVRPDERDGKQIVLFGVHRRTAKTGQ